MKRHAKDGALIRAHKEVLKMLVIKRTGNTQEFDEEKIKAAVAKAMSRTDYEDDKLQKKVVRYVKDTISGDVIEEIEVDDLHKLVENGIMKAQAYDVAREYVTYRKDNMPDIFRERLTLKPYEYPRLADYVDAIQQSYWIVSEYDFTSDVQDYKSNLTYPEKEAARKSMLAISQVEVAVKTFWGKVGDRLPKPEIQGVGATFSENEQRHLMAYAHLLEVLGLNKDFETILEVPAIKKRVNYAQKALAKAKTDSNKDYLESVLLFTLFIENVSLFSQFLILSQMNKERSVLKGMSNVISATSLEEQLHNDFGCEIVNIIRKEHPEWFDEDLNDRVEFLVQEAFEAEKSIVEWIFEEGDFDYLTTGEVVEYIKNRFNMGLEQAGFKKSFEVDEKLLERTEWFDLQNASTMHTDFFSKKPVNYTKNSKSFNEDDLF